MTKWLTPVARIVWGNPVKGRGKTDNADKPVLGEDGKQVMQWSFGLAIPKAHEAELRTVLAAEAATLFPAGVPANFAWKIKNGDGLDDQGKPFNTREGYAGHWVLSVSTEAFAPRIVKLSGNSYVPWDQVKTGDYIRVEVDVKAHAGKAGTRGSVPGLYINPSIIEFIGYGTEIITGPDAMAVFGGQAVALPPGASATPLAPTVALPANVAAPGPANPVAAPGGPFAASPSPIASPTSGPMPGQPQPGYQPHPGFVTAATGQPVPPGFTPPPTPTVPGPGMPGYQPRWQQDAAGFYDANIGPHARYVAPAPVAPPAGPAGPF